uniref:HELP domain-containing protein n=1 Tax=Toxocara canis TaxID=6265 RepID=A0A183U0N9_TOXCA
LRSSTADLLRRLTLLEQSAAQQSLSQRPTPSHANDVFSRLSATSHSAKTNMVNVSTDRSARGSPMRKWMSNVDVKENHNSSISPTHPLSHSLRNASSALYTMRDPVYLAEQRMLQVFIRGRSMMLTVPNSIASVDPLRELDAPKKVAQLEWVHG